MKKIKFHIAALALCSFLLLYACSKDNIDITNETSDPFNPEIENILQADSGVWLLALDTSYVLDSCYASIDTFSNPDLRYIWDFAAANSTGMWPWYYIQFSSTSIAPGVYEADYFQIRTYIDPNIIDQTWRDDQVDIQVEILEVGDVGEGISGIMSGKLINDDGSEELISGEFNQLYRYY